MIVLGIVLLIFSVACFAHFVWTVQREIRKSREWLKTFQAEEDARQREFLQKLSEKL